MSGVDYRYRPWQKAAAEKIVEQLRDGTLSRVAAVGARVRDVSEDQAMVSQIVAVLMNFSQESGS